MSVKAMNSRRNKPKPKVGTGTTVVVLITACLALLFQMKLLSRFSGTTDRALPNTPKPSAAKTSRFLNNTKILLFITSHLSDQHLRHLNCCWPRLVEKSKLISNADILFFSNSELSNGTSRDSIDALFQNNPSLLHKHAPPERLEELKDWQKNQRQALYQGGATLPLEFAYREGWFDGYDWVVRINPDLIIRNSDFLTEAMTHWEDWPNMNARLNQTGIDGIFHKCTGTLLHTDFFAFRPNLDIFRFNRTQPNETYHGPFNIRDQKGRGKSFGNHELFVTKHFQPILDSGRWAAVPDIQNSHGMCRLKGIPMIHDHESCKGDVPVSEYGSLPCNVLEDFEIT